MADSDALNPVVPANPAVSIQPIVTEEKKQIENKPERLYGFQTHPENINRNGRPHKLYSITETIQRMMGEKPEIKKALAQRILKMALDGDFNAIKTIWNYMDGQPLQKSEIGGADGNAILLNILAGRTYVSESGGIAAASEDSIVRDAATVQDARLAPEKPEDNNSNNAVGSALPPQTGDLLAPLPDIQRGEGLSVAGSTDALQDHPAPDHREDERVGAGGVLQEQVNLSAQGVGQPGTIEGSGTVGGSA